MMLKAVAVLVLLGGAVVLQAAARQPGRAPKAAHAHQAHSNKSSTATTTTSPTTTTTTTTTEAPQTEAPQPAEDATTTTEAPETTTTTSEPAAPETTIATTPAATNAVSTTTESPSLEDEAIPESAVGESRGYGGYMTVDEPFKWLGILYKNKWDARKYPDWFGGTIILVNRTRALVHRAVYLKAQSNDHRIPAEVMFTYGFGQRYFHADTNMYYIPAGDVFFVEDRALENIISVGFFHQFFPKKDVYIPTQQELGHDPVIEKDIHAPAADCWMYMWNQHEDYSEVNFTRIYRKLQVIKKKCDDKAKDCYFGMDTLQHNWLGGVCPDKRDLGSPIVCDGKLSYMVSWYAPHWPSCGNVFKALRLAAFYDDIYSHDPQTVVTSDLVVEFKDILKDPIGNFKKYMQDWDRPLPQIPPLYKRLLQGAWHLVSHHFGR